MNQIVDGINGGLPCDNHSVSLSTNGGNFEGSSCSGVTLKKGPWSSAEDAILAAYVKRHGEGNWNAIQKSTGLLRCGKSCRLRWVNHLRPNLKRGAFTLEEERLIIELHAKMGNKWARMAAHLPGRTDNEIKNYWNTRIKRHQRAGLPVCPPELYSQESNGQHFRRSTSNGTSGVKQNRTSLRATDFKRADINFGGIKVNQSLLAYVPELPHISASGMKFKISSCSEHYGLIAPTNHYQKSLPEPNWQLPGFNHPIKGGSLTLKQTQNYSLKSAQPLRLSLTSDPSASKPTLEAVKSELPSVQYLETCSGIGDISCPPLPSCEFQDTCLHSPPMGKIPSGTLSKNGGLLDALIPDTLTSHTAMQISSTKSSNSTPTNGVESSTSTMCRTTIEAELCLDHISPISRSTTSIFCERTTASASISTSNHSATGACSGSNLKLEAVEQVWSTNTEKDEFSDWMDFSMPDYLLDAECIHQDAMCLKDEATVNHAVGTLVSDNADFSYEPEATGSSQSSPSCGWDSFTWKNMPSVYQSPELH